MHRITIVALIVCLGILPNKTFAFGSVYCGQRDGMLRCAAVVKRSSPQEAASQAFISCSVRNINGCGSPMNLTAFSNACLSVASPTAQSSITDTASIRPNYEAAIQDAKQRCEQSSHVPCATAITACDTDTYSGIFTPAIFPSQTSQPIPFILSLHGLFDIGAIRTGISFGIGVIIVWLAFAKRAGIINFITHGRLPYKLAVYGEDIQCLFKRTQRVNWYGRITFGILANLSMTQDQLTDVRKYWLGRVIAFDSLRRQRQNQLAKMHLQLAATAKLPSKEPTALKQLWAPIKYLLFVVFYLIRAFVSFLFGFFFIRVTIAKLARGTHIESTDVALILQAKEAIEESAKYLKEYLETANTFDGRDEISDA